MKRHLAVPTAVVPVVLATLVLAGCNSGNSSSPEPIIGASSSGSPSSSSNSMSGTIGVKPCSLLTSTEQSQNELTKSNSGTDSGARFCTWKNTTADQGNGYTVSAAVRDHQSIGSFNTDGYTMIPIAPIDGHQARQAHGAEGCIIPLAVGDSARVDVVVSGDPSTECQLAKLYAQLVAPNLSSGS